MHRELAPICLEQLSRLGVPLSELDVRVRSFARDSSERCHELSCPELSGSHALESLSVLDRLRRANELCVRCFDADPDLSDLLEDLHACTSRLSLLEAADRSGAFQRQVRLQHYASLPELGCSVLASGQRILTLAWERLVGDPGLMQALPREQAALVSARPHSRHGSPREEFNRLLRSGQGLDLARSHVRVVVPEARHHLEEWTQQATSHSRAASHLVVVVHGVRTRPRIPLTFPELSLDIPYADLLVAAFPVRASSSATVAPVTGTPFQRRISLLELPTWALGAARSEGAQMVDDLSSAQAEVLVALWDPEQGGPLKDARLAARAATYLA